MAPARPPADVPRRTQADRSASTRAALADAAIDVLVERGWAAVTVIEVCTRVGVTRGAFHHQYDSLPALLADALRRLYAESVEGLPARGEGLVALVDATWAAVSAPRFKAVLEAWLAMGNDPGLQAEIGPVVAGFAALVDPDAASVPALADPAARDAFLAAREAMLGLALGRATNGGRPLAHEGRVLDRLRAEAAALESPPARRRRA